MLRFPPSYLRHVVSIHTSAREVTFSKVFDFTIHLSFNPHFRKGSDNCPYISVLIRSSFNPHFRKGSDINTALCCATTVSFNPHFRKGSDGAASSLSHKYTRFNPHFRKGSDFYLTPLDHYIKVSIHTSAREVTCVKWIKQYVGEVSIHTSAREVTRSAFIEIRSIKFQSTLPQGK